MQFPNGDDHMPEPIAVVGLSCKFAAGASSPAKFWDMLAAGRSGWTEFPGSRFNSEGAYHPKVDKQSTVNVRGGYFLEEDLAHFDAQFFSFSAETAASLDPQIRLQLECVYEALENAGLPLHQVAGTPTAVYAAAFAHDYREAIIRDEDNQPRFLPTGTGDAMFSNRISHFFDLKGPSFTLDTGCSGGLVALHQGIQTLRYGESNTSIVCGSTICLNPDNFKTMGSLGVLSPDGVSYTFDSRANGYGRGEGVATLVLKRLSDALRDGDPIRAIIRESGLNQDGRTETITTPSEAAQVLLMQDCYSRAGLDPIHTQYIEAHGTGTPTGDLIECRAIAAAFHLRPNDPLRIGSVKTNIGHTEPVSGLASLIKVILAMEKGKIPPSINFKKPHPSLALEDWGMKVVTELEEWPAGPGGIRRASVNNFGYGGTNGHLIVDSVTPELFLEHVNSRVNGPFEEDINNYTIGHTNGNLHGGENDYKKNGFHEHSTPAVYLTSQVLVLSSQTEQGCLDAVAKCKKYLSRHSGDDKEILLQSLVYTLGQRRTRFPWTIAHHLPVGGGLPKALSVLDVASRSPRRNSGPPRVGMIFTGQGAQWYAMGRELIAAYPVFESSLREADQYIKMFGGKWSIIDELNKKEEESRVNEVALSTPLCVAVQISLVRLLESWGVNPVAVTSHSSGEIAAAYAAGGLSYQSAMAVAYHRAVLTANETLRGSARGAMIAIGMGLQDTEAFCAQVRAESGSVVAACMNSPSSTTVSGDEDLVIKLEALAKEKGVFVRRLKVGTAFHSHHMRPLTGPYREILSKCLVGPDEDEPKRNVSFSSPVAGRSVDISRLVKAEHWVDSLVEPVRFTDAFTDMVLGGDAGSPGSMVDIVVEVGPHKALGGPVQEILTLPEFLGLNIPYTTCLSRGTDAVESMQSLVASLLMNGYPVNLDAVNFPRGRPSSVKVLSDLPSYSWNHGTRHWYESRLNRALRERHQPPHSLLGSPVLGTDVNNPSWRHILKLKDTPWVRNHIVQGNILYPGSGYICHAIEAIKQHSILQSKNGQKIEGYLLRDIEILQALIIPDADEGVEIQTSLRQMDDKAIGSRGWMHFEILSVDHASQWTLHARGLITMEQEDAPDRTIPRPCPDALTGYTRRFQGHFFYSTLRSVGIDLCGPFQTLGDIQQAGDNTRAESSVVIPDTSLPSDLPQQPVVHPITMDGVIQTGFAPVIGKSGNEHGRVPRKISSIWVSSRIANNPGHQFKTYASLRHQDSRVLCTDILLANHTGDTSTPPVLEITEAMFQSLGGGPAEQGTDTSWEKEPCMKVEWAPDVSMLSSRGHGQISQQLSIPVDEAEIKVLKELRQVGLYYLADTVAALTPDDLAQLQSHHAKFHTWMQHQLKLASDGAFGSDSATWVHHTPEQRKPLIDKVGSSSINGELVCHLGPQMPAILRQEKQPLEVLMENDMLHRFYQHGVKFKRSIMQAVRIFQNMIHKNPRARILEIGGGTGGLTRHILPKIGTGKTGAPLAELYHFTDISPAFFDAAQREFAPWGDILKFDKMDIEVDPGSQGFDLGSYDIVIAAEVLHATRSIEKTLSHVRQLMKPGAQMLLIETTRDFLTHQYVFGLLPGWWLSEEPERAHSPSLSVGLWDKFLRATGFSGIDFDVRDCEDDEWHLLRVITTTAGSVPQPSIQQPDSIVLVARQLAYCDQRWLKALQGNLAFAGHSTTAVDFEAATTEAYQDKWVVFLGEVEQPLLSSLDGTGLEHLQAMIRSCAGLIWVTRGGALDGARPEFSLASGFLRSIRHEYVGRKFVTLDLDPKSTPSLEASIVAIAQVLSTSFGTTEDSVAAASPPYEFEYAERDGVLLVPRLFRDEDRNDFLNPKAADWSSSDAFPTEPLFQSGRPLSLTVGVPGLLDTLAFNDDPEFPVDEQRFPPDAIEFEPRAYGVNFRDVLAAMGQLEERVIGGEAAGVITRVGSRAAAHGYSVGDKIFALLRGAYRSHARIDWTSAMHIPSGLSFEQAASVPVVFVTVYLCLYKIAHLQRGQTVLIHAGAGGVGQTAIQFAKLIGAEVFTTVGSPEKRALITERYGIPDDHIFSSRDRSFAPGILKATDGRGVDVVLNSLAGPLLQESFNIVAPLGHFVEIGKRDLEQNSYLEMKPFAKHITFSSFDLLTLWKHDRKTIHLALAELSQMLEDKVIVPNFGITTFPLGDIGKAFRLLQAGKHVGKVVLTASPQEQVRVIPRAHTARLRCDATYLLVGGAGGIGRSIAHWLVAHGAKHLAVLSRSAETSPTGSILTTELQSKGCRVKLVSCDVSDEGSLARALKTCSEELPPIRGVLQGAMVLQDSLLEHMTIDDYHAPLGPKVKASWNLHSQLKGADLDFFVFLSSTSGVYGVLTQSNYSAGNAYEDALAHHRVSQGLPAVALNLGPVKGVGFVAESSGIEERLFRMGYYPITEEQFLRIFESAILSPFDKQVVVGLNQGPGPHWQTDGAVSLGRDARFRALKYRQSLQSKTGSRADGAAKALLASQLSAATTATEAEDLVIAAVIGKLAAIFMIPEEHIDAAKHLSAYGMDSLGAVELRNMLALQLTVEISIFDIMQSESIAALGAEVVRKTTHVDTALFVS
ncbi:hypothetical protein BDV19DRAFT_62188 [Aspergillus venezuelensis]